MVEDEGDVVCLQHEIDRNHDRAETHQRIAQRDEAVRIAREHRDLVAALNSARGKSRGEPFANGVELAIGPAGRAAGEPEPVRDTIRAPPQGVGKSLPPQICVHGSSPR